MIDDKIRAFHYKIIEALYLFSFIFGISAIKFFETSHNNLNYLILLFFLIFIIIKFSIEDGLFWIKIFSYYILFHSQNLFLLLINKTIGELIVYLTILGILIFSIIVYKKRSILINLGIITILTIIFFIELQQPYFITFLLSIPFVFIISTNFNKINILTNNLITELSTTDDLTGLLNQSGFMKKIEEEFYRSQRYLKTFSVLMIDSDNLKLINDTYGHKYGSMVIVSIADVIKNNIRRTDFAGRYGGDEFVVCLVETDLNGAIEVAERIRKQFELKSFFTKDEKKFNITLSVGVSNYPKSGDTLMDVLEYADKAMYQSKSSGKNKTSFLIKN